MSAKLKVGMKTKREQMCALKLRGIMTGAEEGKYFSISHTRVCSMLYALSAEDMVLTRPDTKTGEYRRGSEEIFSSISRFFDCLRMCGAGILMNNEKENECAANIKRNMASG